MRIGLYLMTAKSVPVLKAALASNLEISHVTTAPATGMLGSSHALIAQLAKAAGIPTFTRAHPPGYEGEYSLASGWRWLLPADNLIVLHDSLLPRFRGFAPLITALVNGEREIGVTAFLAEEGGAFDAGPIISQQSIPVSYPTTVGDVLERLAPLYGSLAEGIFRTLAAGQPLRYTRQAESLATYSIWRDRRDFRIDWRDHAFAIERLVGAAGPPFEGAWTWEEHENREVIVKQAEVVNDLRFEDRHPGKVCRIDPDGPVVICGSGLLKLTSTNPTVDYLKTRFV